MARWYGICCFLFIFTYCLARIGMRDAFEYKKSKKQLKSEKETRPIYYRLLGLFRLDNTNAPHHMRKYAIIRVCNVISLILMSVSLSFISHDSTARWILFTLFGLHIVFLIIPFLLDGVLLSNTKKYGKTLDFDQSKRP